MSRTLLAVTAIFALAAGLGGCGKLGSLERPGPMFGHATTAQAPPTQRQDPNRPVTTVDPRDPNSSPGQDQPTSIAPGGAPPPPPQ
jgi:hypothetical protein